MAEWGFEPLQTLKRVHFARPGALHSAPPQAEVLFLLLLADTRGPSLQKGGRRRTGARQSSGRGTFWSDLCSWLQWEGTSELPAMAMLPEGQSTLGDSTAPCRRWLPGRGGCPPEGLCAEKSSLPAQEGSTLVQGCRQPRQIW